MTPDFIRTEHADPHRARARHILQHHPGVRRLMGRNPVTALMALALIALQLAAAWAVRAWELPWWGAVLAAALLGVHVVHALYAVIHEAAHRLVFASRRANRLLTLACNVPLVAPFAVALSHYHLLHHRAQGQLGRDPDLPAPWERRWFAGGPLRKLMYCALFPLLMLLRPIQPRDRLSLRDGWLLTNIALQLVVSLAIVWLIGPIALLYLLASVYFWSGLHPLFGRYVQEHFVTESGGHETHSYYGPLNHVTLNIGYHVEHHDLPSIPWNRLPQLTAMAPSLYGDRTRHHSWAALWWQFIVDREVTVASRVARPASGEADDGLVPACPASGGAMPPDPATICGPSQAAS